jgi:NarL family two-component system response regulator LiaR
MDKIKVVIADDHVLFREGTRNLIEREKDLEVIGEAGDGEEAIRLVTQLHPHVALIDIAMPKVNGIEVTRQIKAQCPATAALILTAYDDDPYVFALLEAGAAGYLLKNVSGKELVNAIRAVHDGEAVLHPAIAEKVFSRVAASAPKPGPIPQPNDLSEREMEVLRLAAKGMNNQDIADKLYLSRRTVQSHMAKIFHKMNVGSRTEATIQAFGRGWLTLDDIA